jgi:putative spermidine/putrescine transport system permease protein
MKRPRIAHLVLVIIGAIVVLFLIAPTLIVVATSFGSTRSLVFPPKGFSLHWYGNFFTGQWLQPTLTSLKVALLASIVATVFGTMAALGIVRGKFPGQQAVRALFLAPLIVPTVVVAIGIYSVFSRWRLVGTVPGLVMAHSALGIPFVLATVGSSLQTVDPTLERAAASLGANRVAVFWRITLPLILPALLAGAVFAFVTSLDEVVIAIFLTTPTLVTLPVQIWSTLQDFLDPTIAAISGMLLAVTVIALVGSFAVRRKAQIASDL